MSMESTAVEAEERQNRRAGQEVCLRKSVEKDVKKCYSIYNCRFFTIRRAAVLKNVGGALPSVCFVKAGGIV